jgi:HlyD family secretion protein
MLAGMAVVALLFVGFGGWAATTDIAGAVVAHGIVVVENSVKKVQHPTGGVVREVLVKDGDHVNAGDVVLRLDETIARANRSVVAKALGELEARRARLEAERDGRDALAFPASLTAPDAGPEAAEAMASESRLFAFRRTARDGKRAQLRERVEQLRKEIAGMEGQSGAKRGEITLIRQELEGVRELWRKNLVQLSRVNALEREAARLDGELNRLAASIAEARGRITETELQMIQVDQDLRSEVGQDLRDVQAKAIELTERKVAADDLLARVELKAPQSGRVHQLAVHTVGGVIQPGEELMLIVPENDELSVEARISPQEIDRVAPGQPTMLRFAAFNQRVTPQVEGVLSRVSADVTEDKRTGALFYEARIAIPAGAMGPTGLKIVPGIPVDAYIHTEDRTVLSYLVRPVTEQMERAFRER